MQRHVKASRFRWFAGGVLLLLVGGACASHEPLPSSDSRSEAAAASGIIEQLRAVLWRTGASSEDTVDLPVRFETPYPPGAWRLADRAELRNSVLWFSHLLIRHRGARSKEVSFSKVGWLAPASPDRSRAEALELAKHLAELARRDPKVFPGLAKHYSEDIGTRERAGALGGVTAFNLLPWPQVLDALAALRPGEVSDVVETEYGFHVLYRTTPPEEQEVSGSHLVIGHAQAEFLQMVARRPLPQRRREEALALAEQAYAEAAAQPERFGELVARYSEHVDAVLSGDLGQWSTWEPTDSPTQIAVLSGLRVGEVSHPVETLFGWELLQRTPHRPRETYAMTAVEISAASPEESVSAAAQANEFAQILRQQPDRFEELQGRGCCTYVAQWPEGRGWPPLMHALSRLAPGQIGDTPISLGMSYVIPKRIAAAPTSQPRAQFELPAPHEPNLAALLTSITREDMTRQLHTVAEGICRELLLAATECARLESLQDRACAAEPSSVASAQEVLQRLVEQLRAEFGDSFVARYAEHLNTHFRRLLLAPAG